MEDDTFDRPEYSGPDWGIVVGLTLIGVGYTGMMLLPFALATWTETGVPALAFGAVLIKIAGVYSFAASRTVVGVVNRIASRIDEADTEIP